MHDFVKPFVSSYQKRFLNRSTHPVWLVWQDWPELSWSFEFVDAKWHVCAQDPCPDHSQPLLQMIKDQLRNAWFCEAFCFELSKAVLRVGLQSSCDKTGQNSVDPLNLLMPSDKCVPKTLLQTILSRCGKRTRIDWDLMHFVRPFVLSCHKRFCE